MSLCMEQALSPQQGTLFDLANEMVRARTKHPSARFLMTALAEELGELAAAILRKEGELQIYSEAIQVACVALRIAEEGIGEHVALTDAEAVP